MRSNEILREIALSVLREKAGQITNLDITNAAGYDFQADLVASEIVTVKKYISEIVK